jgi:hypothetical protein
VPYSSTYSRSITVTLDRPLGGRVVVFERLTYGGLDHQGLRLKAVPIPDYHVHTEWSYTRRSDRWAQLSKR